MAWTACQLEQAHCEWKLRSKNRQNHKYQKPYHGQVPLHAEEDLLPPRILQLFHVDGEKQGPLQHVGHISAFTTSEVPQRGIFHQWLPVEHWGKKPSLGLKLSIDLFALALMPNL